MSKRKILGLALTLCMVAILAVGGTLAYFMDTEKATNTFTMGGVDIKLIEKKYENGAWSDIITVDDENGATTNAAELGKLNPGVVNSFNKCVFTINNEDEAYIRNYVVVESIRENVDEDGYTIAYNNAGLADPSEAAGKYRHGAVLTNVYDDVTINGNIYDIYVFDTIGNAPVKTGESFMTLTTVSLDADVTNEEINTLGNKFEVYTFSEAIQTAGLTYDAGVAALRGTDVDEKAHAITLVTPMVKPQ